MPIPSGPVMKAWSSASSRVRITHHLPGVVDATSKAVSTTQGAKVSHAHPVGAGDESMVSASSRVRITRHLPGVVDARSSAVLAPPKVPRSLMPIPSGPVMKAW